MTLMEVVDGIAVEIGQEFMDPDNKLNEPEDILEICGGLIYLDKKDFTLRLAHSTVKEYLISTNMVEGPVANYRVQHTIAHAELAKMCLTYITFDDFGDGPCGDYETHFEKYPLLAYAVTYWPKHVSECEHNSDETLNQLVLGFFRLGPNSEKFQAWRQLYDIFRTSDRPATALEINRSIKTIKWSPATPLYFAASMGHLQAVKELLELGAHVSVQGGEFGTPVAATVMGGHEETLRFLLEKGADPNQKKDEKSNENLLYLAAVDGHAKCVQTLLNFNADAEQFAVSDPKNPLSAAAFAGHENVMEVLVDADYFRIKELHGDPLRGILYAGDNSSFVMAFQYSGWQGFEKLFRTLFQRGKEFLLAPPATLGGDIFRYTVRRAVAQGHLKIIKAILQDKDAKTLCIDDDMFRTLLHEAAYAGREKIVDHLLDLRKTPGPKATGFSLHLAAANGNVKILERLIKAGANPDCLDDDGWSPILCASEYHNHSAVENLSKAVDFPRALDMISKVSLNSWDISRQPEVSTDGLEIIGK